MRRPYRDLNSRQHRELQYSSSALECAVHLCFHSKNPERDSGIQHKEL